MPSEVEVPVEASNTRQGGATVAVSERVFVDVVDDRSDNVRLVLGDAIQ